MSYSADTFVADEQPTTAKWNKLWNNDASFNDGTGIGDNTIDSRHYIDGSIDPEHLMAGAGNSWSNSFTPSWTNFTIGNGSQSGSYSQIGKWVFGDIYITCGSSTAFGTDSRFNPPVAANTKYDTRRVFTVGQAMYHDSGTGFFQGGVHFESATDPGKLILFVSNAGGTYVSRQSISSTVPFTIAANDTIAINFAYEAA